MFGQRFSRHLEKCTIYYTEWPPTHIPLPYARHTYIFFLHHMSAICHSV